MSDIPTRARPGPPMAQDALLQAGDPRQQPDRAA